METSTLLEIIYVSAAKSPLPAAALAALLAVSRRDNKRAGISGLLIHRESSFLQVLEGPEEAVRATFARIERDARHHRVLVISRGAVPQRSFAEWTMGYVEDAAGARRLDGFNDFFRVGLDKAGLVAEDAERVRSVTRQFKEGRWRQRVEAA